NSFLERQLIYVFYSRRTEYHRPIFVSFTSTSDTATTLPFPIGTSLAATTTGFNKVPPPGPEKSLHSEREFYTSTPGHNQMLINYVTEKLPKTIPSHGLPAFETNLKHNLVGDVFTLDGSNGTLKLE